MNAPFRERWKVAVPSWMRLPPVQRAGSIVVRSRNEVRALEAGTGEALWSVLVDPGRGAGHLLHASGDAVITDRRRDPARTTELVVVRAGRIERTIATGCVIVSGASLVHDGVFHTIGNDPEAGVVYRAFDLRTGNAWSTRACPPSARR